MPTLHILVGMPGSGKTTLMDQIVSANPALYHIDDYFKDSPNAGEGFRGGRCYLELHDQLRAGVDCVISDIEWFRERKRMQIAEHLRQDLGQTFAGVKLDWRFFANDFENCVHNVIHRPNPTGLRIIQVKKILELTKEYRLPSGTVTVPIYRRTLAT